MEKSASESGGGEIAGGVRAGDVGVGEIAGDAVGEGCGEGGDRVEASWSLCRS